MERRHGSLIRAARAQRQAALPGSERAPHVARPAEGPAARASAFMSLRDGMGELIAALIRRLQGLDGMTLLRGRRVVRLTRLPPGVDGLPAAGTEAAAGAMPPRYRVQLDDGTGLDADAVVLATPASVSADLVEPFAAGLASGLREICYVSSATVSLGYRRADIDHPLHGSGFLVPRHEQRTIRACTWTSSKFAGRAPTDQVLLRAFVGGAWDGHLVDLDDAQLVRLVRDELQAIMGIRATPVLWDVCRWRNGNPQYAVGHLERVAALDTQCSPGLFLTGSAYRGVGLPDCIHSAQQAAAQAVQYLTSLLPHRRLAFSVGDAPVRPAPARLERGADGELSG
jgi:oxygen-dependent protoporphyrinogen oxidase